MMIATVLHNIIQYDLLYTSVIYYLLMNIIGTYNYKYTYYYKYFV